MNRCVPLQVFDVERLDPQRGLVRQILDRLDVIAGAKPLLQFRARLDHAHGFVVSRVADRLRRRYEQTLSPWPLVRYITVPQQARAVRRLALPLRMPASTVSSGRSRVRGPCHCHRPPGDPGQLVGGINSGSWPGLISGTAAGNPNRDDAAKSTSSGGETELKYMIMTFGIGPGWGQGSPSGSGA